MKYDLTRIVNESFTIELRLIATNFLRLVSWILVLGHGRSELGCCCLTIWTQTLNWLTAPPHWLYARIMLYCGTNEILIYRAPAILPQKMSVIGKKWQCSVHQDWLIMMSDEDMEFFWSYLNIGESQLPRIMIWICFVSVDSTFEGMIFSVTRCRVRNRNNISASPN